MIVLRKIARASTPPVEICRELNPNARGKTPVPIGSTSKTVTFDTPQPDTDFNLSVDLVTSDSDPSAFSWVTTSKNVNGFTVIFSGLIDTSNYVLEWEVFRYSYVTDASHAVVADTVSGTSNGVNKVFYTTHKYKKDHIIFYMNGQALKPVDDFDQTGDKEVTLIYNAPLPDDVLMATYEIDAPALDPGLRGRTNVSLGATNTTITFPTPFDDTNYNLSIDLVTSTGSPSIYSWIVNSKSINGFNVVFSGAIDTSTYVLEWEVFK